MSLRNVHLLASPMTGEVYLARAGSGPAVAEKKPIDRAELLGVVVISGFVNAQRLDVITEEVRIGESGRYRVTIERLSPKRGSHG